MSTLTPPSSRGTPSGAVTSHSGLLNGVLFVALFAFAVTQLAAWPPIARLGMSPLIVGIACGALYGNVLRAGMPDSWAAGVNFSARKLLRIAVAFFGLRVSLQEIAQVGLAGLVMSAVVVAATLAIGWWIGTRWLKLDRDTALLTAAGSAICGAAAVVAFESTLQSKPHKSTMAVGTVVLFGTLSMFVYPLMASAGWLHLDTMGLGLYFGGTIHEVAQVVGAANDPRDTAGACNLRGRVVHRPRRAPRTAGRQRCAAQQAAGTVVRARLPRAGAGQLAARDPVARVAGPQRPGYVRADDGDDCAGHRDAGLADPRGRAACARGRHAAASVADGRRLRADARRRTLARLMRRRGVREAVHRRVPRSRERHERLRRMQKHRDKIDAELAKEMIADRYDVYPDRDDHPSSRTICGYLELDDARFGSADH
ncbi:hypothetical protein DFQ28_007946, partial [Apophysomyces sp. BC1034]